MTTTKVKVVVTQPSVVLYKKNLDFILNYFLYILLCWKDITEGTQYYICMIGNIIKGKC